MADLLVLGAVKKLENNSMAIVNGDFKNDRFLEPCFAVVTVHGGSHWGAIVYDHNLNFIGRSNYTSSHGDGQAMGGTGGNNAGSDGGESYYGHAQTQGHAGGNSGYGSLTCKNSHLGHVCVDVAGDGTLVMRNAGYAGQAPRNLGTWLHNTTPDLCIFQQNNISYTGPRSHAGGIVTLTAKDGYVTGRFHGTDDFSTNAKYGMISYNELTKKLAIGESNGSYYLRFHVYSGVERPASFADQRDFWSTTNISPTRKVITPWQDWRPTNNDQEDNYRAIVVLCDNGDIVFHRMITHWGAYSCKFTYNSTTGQYNAFGGSTTNVQSSWTTTYGMENNPMYGARYQISNSGRYVIAYNAAYYYGAGVQATIIRVSDGKRLHTMIQDSNYGVAIVPWRDDYFCFSRDINTDGGAMLYFYSINPPQDMRDVADKGAFVWDNVMQYTFDSTFHSTCYPYMVPITEQNYYKFVQ